MTAALARLEEEMEEGMAEEPQWISTGASTTSRARRVGLIITIYITSPISCVLI
jgi:hypothetical protein